MAHPTYDISGYCVDRENKRAYPFRIFDIDTYVVYATDRGNVKYSRKIFDYLYVIADTEVAKALYELE